MAAAHCVAAHRQMATEEQGGADLKGNRSEPTSSLIPRLVQRARAGSGFAQKSRGVNGETAQKAGARKEAAGKVRKCSLQRLGGKIF